MFVCKFFIRCCCCFTHIEMNVNVKKNTFIIAVCAISGTGGSFCVFAAVAHISILVAAAIMIQNRHQQ